MSMRIALVLDQFDPARGGLEQWTATLAERLVARGHDIHVVARRFAPPDPPPGMSFHRIDGAKPGMEFGARAIPVLLSLAPDVIHDMGVGWYCDVFQPHCGSRPAVAERKTAHWPGWLRCAKRAVDGLSPRQRRFRELLALQYAPEGQTFVAVSDLVAGDLERFHGVPPSRIRTIHNGVDTERFTPANRAAWRGPTRRRLGIADEAVVALLVAHNFRLKGVATLLRAVARLRREDAPLHAVVVGGDRLGGWRRTARRLGVEQCVTFAGARADTVPFYAAADLYVHPTLYDSCSLVALEAAAAGLPLVTTRTNGASEMFREGFEQLLLDDPRDDAALAGAMRRLLDPAMRSAMGRAARRRALDYPIERNVAEIAAIYEEIAGRREAPIRIRPFARGADAEGSPDSSAIGAAQPQEVL